MSLFGAAAGGPLERRDAITNSLIERILAGARSSTGIHVSIDRALQVAGVLGCLRVIAEDIGQLPGRLYREEKSGRKSVATEHRLHQVLSLRPNKFQNAMQWRETSIYHAALSHGAFGLPIRVGGEVDEILPLVPANVTIRQDPKWNVIYSLQGANGAVLGEFPREEVFHVAGPSWNGYQAMRMVRLAADAVGLAIATQDQQANLHKNGGRPSGILSYPHSLDQPQKDDIAKAWTSAFGGGAFGTAVMDLGAKYEQLAMTGVDAQTLESRRMQLEEICRILRVFPLMVGHSDKTSTYAASEQFFIAHVTYTLGPWIARFEQEVDNRLLTKAERAKGYFSKLDTRGLLRGDHKSRAEYYAKSLGTSSSPGWNSPNDIRRLEDQDLSDQKGADDIVTVDRLTGQAPPATDAGSKP